MKIDDKALDKLQKLSMIEIPDSKRDELKDELNDIVKLMDSLNDIDTQKLDAFCKIKEAGTGTPMRDDICLESNKEFRDNVLQHAPLSKDGFFIVPKIL